MKWEVSSADGLEDRIVIADHLDVQGGCLVFYSCIGVESTISLAIGSTGWRSVWSLDIEDSSEDE